MVGVASDASDSRARGGGLTFASRLDRAEDEDSPAENAAERATEVPRPTEPAISPAKENVPSQANLSSTTRRLRRARYQSLPSKMKRVCHPQTSRVRLDDRRARRGQVCVCEERKRCMDSTSTWRIIIHVHYIATRCKCKISPLSLRTTLRRVACRWSTPPSFVRLL